MIREWGLLRHWLAEDHDFLTWCGDIEVDYQQWKSSGGRTPHDTELLLRGSALDQALHRLQSHPGELNDEVTSFIQLSNRAERERLTRDRRRVHLLATVLAVAVGLGLYSGFETMQVADQRDLALSRQLAVSATNQLVIDPELSLLLAQEAYKVSPTPEAEAALRQATLDSQVRAMSIPSNCGDLGCGDGERVADLVEPACGVGAAAGDSTGAGSG